MTQPNAHELRGYLDAAENVIRESQAFCLSAHNQDLSKSIKGDGSPVTKADFAIEDHIRSRLQAEFPDHGVIGEERGITAPESGLYWVIDPIDGTRSFIHQIPLYGTLLALRNRDESIVGAISLPGLDLLYSGALGLGVCRNGERIQLPAPEAPSAIEYEILAIGDRRQFVSCGRTAVFDGLMQSALSVRTYCDCFGHALAIDGRVGAMVDFGVSIWDIAATELLVREAGGLFEYIGATPGDGVGGGRYNVVFGKSHVVKWVLERIGEIEI